MTLRRSLRQQLLEQRERFVSGPQGAEAAAALARHLAGVLRTLEPELLGVYWPYRSEFNAANAIDDDSTLAPLLKKLPRALPFAQRAPVQMHYRRWDGRPPTAVDDCGIPSSDGAVVVPDVVLVPCVGFTPDGFRLGYGGGYFDRWLAQHPGVTAIGVAYAVAEVDPAVFGAQAHDLPLGLVVTERGIV